MIRRIMPLAFDSFEVRSMTTFVETDDLKGGWQRLDETWEILKKYVLDSEMLVLTHYHYDQHDSDYPEFYGGKTVFIKLVYEEAEKRGFRVITAAEFSGRMVKWMLQ